MSESPQPERNARGRTPLGALLARATHAAIDLIKSELEDYKAGLVRKLRETGVALALFAAAGVLALFMLGYLIFAIYGAFLLLVSPWLASLITAGVLLVLVGVLAFLGAKLLQRHGVPSAGAAVGRVKTNIGGAIHDARTAQQPSSEDHG